MDSRLATVVLLAALSAAPVAAQWDLGVSTSPDPATGSVYGLPTVALSTTAAGPEQRWLFVSEQVKFDPAQGVNTGAVHTYLQVGQAFQYRQTLRPQGAANFALFGRSVDADGRHLVIGAIGETSESSRSLSYHSTPLAQVSLIPSVASPGDTIMLSGAGSFDDDGGPIVSYIWSFAGGVYPAIPPTMDATVPWDIPTDATLGPLTIRLKVVDDDGEASSNMGEAELEIQ